MEGPWDEGYRRAEAAHKVRARQALVPLQYTPKVEAIPSISVLVFPAIVVPLVPSVTILKPPHIRDQPTWWITNSRMLMHLNTTVMPPSNPTMKNSHRSGPPG